MENGLSFHLHWKKLTLRSVLLPDCVLLLVVNVVPPFRKIGDLGPDHLPPLVFVQLHHHVVQDVLGLISVVVIKSLQPAWGGAIYNAVTQYQDIYSRPVPDQESFGTGPHRQTDRIKIFMSERSLILMLLMLLSPAFWRERSAKRVGALWFRGYFSLFKNTNIWPTIKSIPHVNISNLFFVCFHRFL